MATGQITGVLLAAGSSSRFGSNKLLKMLSDGYPIGIVSATNLSKIVDDLTIVVGEYNDKTDILFKENGFETVVADNSKLGMGNSLKSGIANNLDSFGWIIGLADMPYIGENILNLLVLEIKKGAKITAPFFEGRRGHPVGFGQSVRADLLSIDDAMGASNILDKHREELVKVITDDHGVVHDIDHPEDILDHGTFTKF